MPAQSQRPCGPAGGARRGTASSGGRPATETRGETAGTSRSTELCGSSGMGSQGAGRSLIQPSATSPCCARLGLLQWRSFRKSVQPDRTREGPWIRPGDRMAPAEPERLAFVLIDGVGDVSIPQFGFKTPLEVANLPHLDAVAGASLQRRRATAAAGAWPAFPSHEPSSGPAVWTAALQLLPCRPRCSGGLQRADGPRGAGAGLRL